MILHAFTVLLLTLLAGVAVSIYFIGWTISPFSMIMLHFIVLWFIVNLAKR